MSTKILKEYLKLLIQECGCEPIVKPMTDVTIDLETKNEPKKAGAFEYDDEGLMLDDPRGTVVEPDVRAAIKNYFKAMHLLPSSKK